jgi:hypothetical protein
MRERERERAPHIMYTKVSARVLAPSVLGSIAVKERYKETIKDAYERDPIWFNYCKRDPYDDHKRDHTRTI